ncbi:hypothetical protein [Rhodococcus sp. NPDC059234]
MGSSATDMANLGTAAKVLGLATGLLSGAGAVLGTGLFLASMS